MEEGQVEVICKGCGIKFYSEDSEMIYCSNCWKSYLRAQINRFPRIKLTKDFLISRGFIEPTNDTDWDSLL